MSSFSQDFSSLIHKLPKEESSIRCLEKLISMPGAKDKQYTLRRLQQLCHPSSLESLDLILDMLTEDGVLEKNFIIYSPRTGEYIGSYREFKDIPAEIDDISSDRRVEISVDDIEIMYSLGSRN